MYILIVKVGETKSLLEENASLKEEVEQLKRKLVELETLRGSKLLLALVQMLVNADIIILYSTIQLNPS